MEILNSNRQKIFGNFFLTVILIIIIGLIAGLYISQERYFYFWDYSNFANLTDDLVSQLKVSTLDAIKSIQGSLYDAYSKLPSLPLIPSVIIFGNSRPIYIISCALVYILPFSLIMGAIATCIIPVYPRVVFWFTAYLTILIPATWVSILRGYPDIGAATIIALAVLVYLKDANFKYWWSIPLIGFLLAVAILFRRHFAYSVSAFLAAIFLKNLAIFLVEARKYFRKALRNLNIYCLKIGLIVISILVTLEILAPGLTHKIFIANYQSLYSSYKYPAIIILEYYIREYGWFVWILAIAGFFTGILTNFLVRSNIFFLGFFGAISVVQWVIFVRFPSVHYATHFIIFIVLGISLAICTMYFILKRKTRILILYAIILLLIINALLGLTPVLKFNNLFRSLFAANNLPLTRSDLSQVAQLIAYLRKIAAHNEGIYVAASSFVLNSSLIQQAEKQLYGERKLNVFYTSDIDSRDSLPLNNLLQARYVIIATPFQHHLSPEKQEIVKFVVDLFTEHGEFAKDFRRLPEDFVLDQGVIVSIYQRSRPTSQQIASDTLKSMQSRIKYNHGG